MASVPSPTLPAAMGVRLQAVVAAHSCLTLDAPAGKVRWDGGRTFSSSNVLHLERFVKGRRFLTFEAAAGARKPGFILPASALNVIGFPEGTLEWRLEALRQALVAHAAIARHCGIDFHTLGRASARSSPSSQPQTRSHCGRWPDARTSQGTTFSRPALVRPQASRKGAKAILVATCSPRLARFPLGSASWSA